MNKKLIRLTEQDLHRIVKESVNKILNEGIEYNGEDAYDEIEHYMQQINDTYNEIAHLKVAKGCDNNDLLKNDIDLLERYVKMMYAHIRKLQQSVQPLPTMGQVLDKPTPMVHY